MDGGHDRQAGSTSGRRGVLLVNLGSPDAPTAEAVRRYLAEFLADPRVVDWPRWLWLPLLRGIILPKRSPRSAALYERVWTADGSPLIAVSQRQGQGLATALGDDWVVAVAMRYGNPSLTAGFDTLQAAGCSDVVVLPMFPQSAEATTGSVVAAVEQLAASRGARPELTIVPPYPTDAGYVGAVAAAVEEAAAEDPPDHYVFSFHGIPARVVRRGDVYRTHCEQTAAALARRLQLADDRWSLVFQSRFGPEKWLEPYADQYVIALASTHPRLLVATPGFTADCLETIDEIGNELGHAFREAGGESLRLVPCVNDRADWIAAMADLVRRAAEG